MSSSKGSKSTLIRVNFARSRMVSCFNCVQVCSSFDRLLRLVINKQERYNGNWCNCAAQVLMGMIVFEIESLGTFTLVHSFCIVVVVVVVHLNKCSS